MSADENTTNEVDWLSDAEMEAWLALVGVTYRLPQALDKQLRRDFGISHSYYTVLSSISEAPGGQLCMGEIAQLAWSSPSRLTHAVSKLEERGWVTRESDPSDRRNQIARLTAEGWAALREMAPTHLAQVRASVFDHLDADDVAAMARVAGKLRAALQGDSGA